MSHDAEDIKEVLSSREEAFERKRKKAGLVLGPLVFLILYFTPFPALNDSGHKLLAILGFVVIFWITEAVPIPVTALLGVALSAVLGAATVKDALAGFSDHIIFLFIGSFIIAEAISMHGLDKRFSLAILSIRFFGQTPRGILLAFGIITAVVSMWISNTAAAAMMLPVGIGILSVIKAASGSEADAAFNRYAAVLMLMIAYGASVGGIATPVGTPPNLIGIAMIEKLTGVRINFYEWMRFALPPTVVMFGVLYLILSSFGASSMKLSGVREYVSAERGKLGNWSVAERNTALCFGVAVLLWVLPSLAMGILGKAHPVSIMLDARLKEGVSAIIAAALLFVLPVSFKELKFTMTWQRAAKIDWGTIILFGSGISLGTMMFSSGLAEAFGKWLASFTFAGGLWGLTAAATLMGIILSETTSNTASANMTIPIVIAMALAMGVHPLPPALGACLGSSFGFMLPVSTPPNAIVYGSGMVPIFTMVKRGILFDIAGFVIIVLGLRIICPLLGWA
ncbi:MAG: DASS family sodium-coupled anion symporter [Deltaproteobacteria bacterium]|nr:DASS family sodium-coupled anion symporter [Deltaproteobacteria bacterium]